MKRFLILIAILPYTFLTSCVRDVILDAKETPQVVVECILSDDPIQILNLSFTKGASLSGAPALTEAKAILYEKDVQVGEFTRQESGEWTLEYAAVPGLTYRLEVQVPGYDLIYSEQEMPQEHAPLCAKESTHFASYIEPWSGWKIESDSAGDWHYNVWPDDEPFPSSETIYVMFHSSTSAWIFAMDYNDENSSHVAAGLICTNAKTTMNNNVSYGYEPPQMDVPNPYKLMEVHPGYNFEDSFYSAHQMELYPTLAGMPMYKSYIRLPEKKAQVFYLSGDFNGDYCEKGVGDWGFAEDTDDKGYILCIAPSKDYDRYLQEAYKYIDIQQSTSMSDIYLRDNIYSNINGGLGIFGAMISRKYPWARTYTYIDSGVPRKNYTPDGYSDPRNKENYYERTRNH